MTTKPAETMTEGQAPGPMTGRRYLESLRDRREVWIDGERVEDVTTHPAFKDMVGELARVYDLQNSPHYRDEMTCIDPTTAQRISVSRGRRTAARISSINGEQRIVERAHLGQLGRSPDILGALHHLRAPPQRRTQWPSSTPDATSAKTRSITIGST